MLFLLVPSSLAQTTVSCSALKQAFQTATLTDNSVGCCDKVSGVIDASTCVPSTDEVNSLKKEVETLQQSTRVTLSEAGLPMSDNFRTIAGGIAANVKSPLFYKTFQDPNSHPADTNDTLARVRLTDAWSKHRPFSTQENVFIGPHAIPTYLNQKPYEDYDVFVQDGYTWIQPAYTEEMKKEYEAFHEFLGYSTYETVSPKSLPELIGESARYSVGHTFSVGARVDLEEDGKTRRVTSAFPSDAGGKRYMELTVRLSLPWMSKELATSLDLGWLSFPASADASKYVVPEPKDIPLEWKESACHTTERYGTRCYFTGNREGFVDRSAANGGFGFGAVEDLPSFVDVAYRVRDVQETFVQFTPRLYIRDDGVYPNNLNCEEGTEVVPVNVTVDGETVLAHKCADENLTYVGAWSSRFVGDDLYLMRGGKDSKAPYQSEMKVLYDTKAEDKTHGEFAVSVMYDGVPTCGTADYTAGQYVPGSPYNKFQGKKFLVPKSGQIVDVPFNLGLAACTGDDFYKAPISADHLPKLINVVKTRSMPIDVPATTFGDVRWETFDSLPHRWTTDGIRAAKLASPVPAAKEDIVPTSYAGANPPMLQTFPPGVFRGSESTLANHVTKRVHILPVTVGGESRTAAVTVYEPVEDGSSNDVLLYLYHAEGEPADDRDADNNYMHQFALSMDMPLVAFRPPGTNTFDGPTKRVRYDGWVGSALRTLGLASRNVHIFCFTRGCSGAEMMMKNEADMQGIRIKAAYYGAALVTGPWEQVPYIPGYTQGVYLDDTSKTLRERTDAMYDAIHQYGTRFTPAGSDNTQSILNDALKEIAYSITFGNLWNEMLPSFRSMFTGRRSSTARAWRNALTTTFTSGDHAAAKDALASMFEDGSAVPSYTNFMTLSGRPEKTIVALSPDDLISRPILRKHTRGDGASDPDAPSVEDVPGATLVLSPSLPTPFQSAAHYMGIHAATRAMLMSDENVLKESSVLPWFGETVIDAKVDALVAEYNLDRSRLVFALYGGVVMAYDTPTVTGWNSYVAGNMTDPRPVTMYSLYVQRNADRFVPSPGHTFPEWQIKDGAGNRSFDASNTVVPRLMTNVHTHIAPQIKAHFLQRGYDLTQLLDGSDNVLYAESLKTTSLSGTNPRGYAMLTVLGDNAVQTYAYVGFNSSFPIPMQNDTNAYFQDERITYVFQRESSEYDVAHAYPYHAASHPLTFFHHPEMEKKGVLPNGKTIFVHTEESVELMNNVDGLKDMYSPVAGADIDYHELGNIHFFGVTNILAKASTLNDDVYPNPYAKAATYGYTWSVASQVGTRETPGYKWNAYKNDDGTYLFDPPLQLGERLTSDHLAKIDEWGISTMQSWAQMNGDPDSWVASQFAGNYNAFHKLYDYTWSVESQVGTRDTPGYKWNAYKNSDGTYLFDPPLELGERLTSDHLSKIDAFGIATGQSWAQMNGDPGSWINTQFTGRFNAFFQIRW